MKVILNQFYISQVKAILAIIDKSKGGKKIILPPLKGENDYLIQVDRTTYPDFIRFFFVKSPKDRYIEYPYLEGYYNGNRKELLRILNNLILGKVRTERQEYFIEQLFYLWYWYIRDFEEENNEKYFEWSEEDYEEIPI